MKFGKSVYYDSDVNWILAFNAFFFLFFRSSSEEDDLGFFASLPEGPFGAVFGAAGFAEVGAKNRLMS